MDCTSFSRDFSCGDMLDIGPNRLEYRNPGHNKIWATFNEMRKANKLCDAVLTSGDAQSFPVHQAILAANSSYFYKYLTASERQNHGDEQASRTLNVTLDQMSGDHLMCILDYMYTRIVFVTMDNALKLLQYADDFKVNGLACHCVRFLLNGLNNYNCFSIWKFSKSHNKKKLLKESMKYILHNFVVISETNPDFLQLSISELLEFIHNDYLNVKTEESIFESVFRWIDHDPASRRNHLIPFLSAMRLGLVKMEYLLENISNHRYVQAEPSCKPIINAAVEFLCDLQKNGCDKVSLLHPLVRPRVPTDVLFTFGGWCGSSPICQFETYDTRADRWYSHPTMQEDIPRAYYGMTVVGQNIYIIGGYDGSNYFNTNKKFDPIHKAWTDLSPMYTKRCYVAAATCNGHMYAMGGYDGHSRLNTVEKYDPTHNQWTRCSGMLYKRSDACADTLTEKIYIAGGFSGDMCLSSVEVYLPDIDQWTICKSMQEPRSGISVIAHNGLLYAIGGFDGLERRATGEKYDPVTKEWTAIREMYSARSNTAIAVIDDMIFVIGGYNGTNTVEYVECYDAERDEWLDATDMTLYRSAFKACVISNLPNVKDYTYYSNIEGSAKKDVHKDTSHHPQQPLKPMPIFGRFEGEMSAL